MAEALETGTYVLRLRSSVEQEIFHAARRAYPEECCGVLLAEPSELVVEAIACANVAAEPRRRYAIAPAELIRIQREARERGLEIAGFYHSHPERPPELSPTDFAEAYWTGCAYVIVSLHGGEVSGVRAYRLVAAGQLVEEPLEVVAPDEPAL